MASSNGANAETSSKSPQSWKYWERIRVTQSSLLEGS
eukprot:CAMPEP_0175916538 /NCGR_PEP_ID=MMETSP0108-20121206/10901_1 /TAXON_ID=195067 ORGANISM="Goniomonas pacifica, Strain CCMP1869" /NCGR_SAMPLE_ID=MMETSP0108 /ASSEMBLY_ACC=CAM_ASM_000204 /LENGTH=36 /DNA_ID= /DNA_START= /DNA_END= /DNA_ORIENTATION=